MAVQKTYTEEMVSKYLNKRKAAGATLREIAENDFHGKVTHGDIHRALNGVFPKGHNKRAAMGLPPLVDIPACPDCGKGHIVGWCVDKFGEPKKPRTNGKTTTPRPPTTIYVGAMTPGEKDKIMEKKPEERKKILLNESFDDQEDSEPFPEVPEDRLEQAMKGWIE